MKFRELTAEEVECRVAVVKDTGLQLLLYKDARCDMNILDETVGAENWQREHYECKGNLFCRVGIKCQIQEGESCYYEWIWKSDCGKESNAESEKGEASDSFKRACFNWGIGRELYTAPFIWVSAKDCNINNKKCFDKFEVSKLDIQNGKIVGLEIQNITKKCCAFTTFRTMSNPQKPSKNIEDLIKRTNTDIVSLLGYYKVKKLADLTDEQVADCISKLERKIG